MINTCSKVASHLSLEFNINKSCCMVFGTCYKTNIVKYVGVHLLCGGDVKFDLMPVKRAFYSSRNSIFMHSKNLNELAV